MAFGSLIKRLFGAAPPPANQPAAAARPAPVAAASRDTPPPPARPLVCRDEIIDGRSRIAGYRFRIQRPTPPDAEAMIASLQQENLAAFAERRLAIVPLTTTEWRTGDFRPVVAAQTTFLLETPPRNVAVDAWLASALDIRAAGARIGIDGVAAATQPAALELADLVLIDFTAHALPEFERLAKALAASRPQIALAADNVHTWPEHRLCQSFGMRYSLGHFAAEPEAVGERDQIDQSRLVLLEMLNLLRREADLAELAELARRDPAVTLKVLAMVNSPATGVGRPVGSIDQAIILLGRDTLYRWLTVSMFRAGTGGARDETLLELALCRARFLELTALGRRSKTESDELFLVGMLSFLDALLGMPLERVLGQMRLPENVTEALLRNAGPYQRHLMLTMALERGRIDLVERFGAEIGLGAGEIGEFHAQALAWSGSALEER